MGIGKKPIAAAHVVDDRGGAAGVDEGLCAGSAQIHAVLQVLGSSHHLHTDADRVSLLLQIMHSIPGVRQTEGFSCRAAVEITFFLPLLWQSRILIKKLSGWAKH